jgi:hypothetical protein
LHGFNPLNSWLIAFKAAPLHINLDVSSGDLLEIKPEPEKDGASGGRPFPRFDDVIYRRMNYKVPYTGVSVANRKSRGDGRLIKSATVRLPPVRSKV